MVMLAIFIGLILATSALIPSWEHPGRDFRHYTVDDGLPANTIFHIKEDALGFIWVSTFTGVARFDGQNFKRFRFPEDPQTGIMSSNSRGFFNTADQQIFAISDTKNYRFNTVTQNFEALPFHHRYTHHHHTHSSSIEHNGIYYFISGDTLHAYHKETGQSHVHMFEGAYVLATKNDSLWISGSEKVGLLHPDGSFSDFYPDFSHIAKQDDTRTNIKLFTSHQPGKLWLIYEYTSSKHISNFALHLWDYKANSLLPIYTQYSDVTLMVREDSYGRFWILPNYGDLSWGWIGKTEIYPGPPLPQGPNIYMTIINDIIWVGTNANGILRIDISPPKFNLIPRGTSLGETKVEHLTKNLFVHGEDIWFTNTMSNPANLRHINAEQHIGKAISIVQNNRMVPVIDAFTDDFIDFYLGTMPNFGFYRYNTKDDSYTEIAHPGLQTSYSGILTKHAQQLWVHGDQSIFAYDLVSEDITEFSFQQLLEDPTLTFTGWQAHGVFDETRNRLWFSFKDYLGELNPDSGEFTFHKIPEAGASFLKHMALVDEKLWIATGNGLLFFDPDSGLKRHFTDRDGLPDNFIYGFLLDNEQRFWISTNRGLSRAKFTFYESLPHGEFKNFTIKDGLQSNEFNSYAYYHDTSTDKFWFAGVGGLNWFYPDQVLDDPETPRLVIDDFRIFNRPAELDTSILYKKHLLIPYSDNDFSLHITGLMYRRQEDISYAWKLEGQDSDWIFSQEERTIRYTNLRPGTYTFLAKAANYDQVWSEPISLSITITAPFWQKTWFLMILTLGFGIVIAGIVHLSSLRKLRAQQRQMEIQQKIKKERERISRDLHDNVGAQINNLIMGLEILNIKNKDNPGIKSPELLQTLDSDARNAISELRETIWLIDREEVTVSEFVQHIRHYLNKQKLCCPELSVSVFYQHQTESELEPSALLHLFRIIQEAFTNTTKYAQAQNFTLTFTTQATDLQVCITDDGCGTNLNALFEGGNGITNMKKRVGESGGNIRFETSIGSGVTIEILLPLSNQKKPKL